jgi:ABC-type antimicrobial peptide transport system permease subunit
MLVSITLTLQFNLFTELAFTFDFPYYLFFSVVAMSIGVAFLGSYLPALSLKKKQIALALKNL